MKKNDVKNEVVETEEINEQEVVEQEPMTEEERLNLIKTYNEQNTDSWIEEVAPTKEEVEAIANEYNEKVSAFNAKKFVIADKDNALRVAKFLKEWNENWVNWKSEGWMGVIFFDAIIKNFIEEYQKEPKDLEIDWQPLTYLYMYMRDISGTGLKNAVKFSEIAEEFNKILDVVGDLFTAHNEEGEKLQKLQQKWQVYEAGFKIHYVDEDGEKPKEN